MGKQSGRSTVAVLISVLCCSIASFAVPGTPELNSAIQSRTIQGFLMVASVSINGRGPYNFLIDTGTNTTLIDPDVAAELGLKPVDRMMLRTLTDSQPAVRYFADTLVVGTASVARLETLATPLVELQKVDRSIRGVLGMNFLLHFSFELDYEHHQFRLYDAAEPAPLDGLRLKVRINDGRILVPAESSYAPDGNWYLGLDSGVAQLVVYGDRIDTARLPCSQAGCMMLVSTNQVAHGAAALVLDEIEFAGSRFRNLPVVVTPARSETNGDLQDGLLPAALFRSVYFDRAAATLIVRAKN